VPVLPSTLEHVPILQVYSALSVRLIFLKFSFVYFFVSEPKEFPLSVDDIIFELTAESSDLGFKSSLPFLLPIVELADIFNLFAIVDVLSKAMHQPVLELPVINFSFSWSISGLSWKCAIVLEFFLFGFNRRGLIYAMFVSFFKKSLVLAAVSVLLSTSSVRLTLSPLSFVAVDLFVA